MILSVEQQTKDSMKSILLRILIFVVIAVLSLILYMSVLGQRLREWLEVSDVKSPKKDPIVEHERYTPHKY